MLCLSCTSDRFLGRFLRRLAVRLRPFAVEVPSPEGHPVPLLALADPLPAPAAPPAAAARVPTPPRPGAVPLPAAAAAAVVHPLPRPLPPPAVPPPLLVEARAQSTPVQDPAKAPPLRIPSEGAFVGLSFRTIVWVNGKSHHPLKTRKPEDLGFAAHGIAWFSDDVCSKFDFFLVNVFCHHDDEK